MLESRIAIDEERMVVLEKDLEITILFGEDADRKYEEVTTMMMLMIVMTAATTSTMIMIMMMMMAMVMVVMMMMTASLSLLKPQCQNKLVIK